MFFWPVEPALPVKKVVPRVEMQRRLQKRYVASAEHASRANRHTAACFIQKSRKAILIGRSALFLSCQAVLRCVFVVSGRVDVHHAAVMRYGVLHITAQRAHARAIAKVLCGKSPLL